MAKNILEIKEGKLSTKKRHRIKDSLQKKGELPYWLNLVIAISVWTSIYVSIALMWNPIIRRIIMITAIIVAYYAVKFANTIARRFVKPSAKMEKQQFFLVLPTEEQKTEIEILQGSD